MNDQNLLIITTCLKFKLLKKSEENRNLLSINKCLNFEFYSNNKIWLILILCFTSGLRK